MFGRKKRASKQAEETTNLPRHIAIIMDGNGRWAKARNLPRTAGHKVGAETFRTIATYCKDIGIDYLTVYAFSTENWSRPQNEVDTIMNLLEKYLHESIEKMERDRVKMKFLGDTTALSPRLQELIAQTSEISKRFEGCQVNICLNYGGRDEILRACETWAKTLKPGETPKLTAEEFSSYLYTDGIPDPDLIIRPSGELRLSNFLLWQAAYAEFYYTDKLWPDFKPSDIDNAISDYNGRNRRFGKVQ